MTTPMTPPKFTIGYSDDHEVSIITLPPRLSAVEAIAFKTTCDELIKQEESLKKIILDCEQTKFIDSSGVGSLVHLLKGTIAKNIELILTNVGTSVQGVLTLTGLSERLIIQPATSVDPANSNNNNSNQDLPETHPSVRSWIKRVIDIVGSLVGLVITGILLIPIAIAIKIDSPGPIFFKQIRCGWLGKKFYIWKFRSMKQDAEKCKAEVLALNKLKDTKMFKSEDDPRITKVGRWLRRTSLDELPQFWNVLKGEMSLVGTRPPTPDEVEQYEVPEWQRLNVKPGMTGEWQVKGRSTIRTFEEVIKLDLDYQHNWSLIYDLKLIIGTVLILFRKNSGAY